MESQVTPAKRNRRKNASSTTERLLESAAQARAEAATLPPVQRDGNCCARRARPKPRHI